MFNRLFLLICLLFFASGLLAQSTMNPGFDYSRYQKMTHDEYNEFRDGELQNLIELDEVDKYVSAIWFPISVRAIYTGEIRPMQEPRKEWIGKIMESRGQGRLIELYQDEMLFEIGDDSYWIPIQSLLKDNFELEMMPYDELDLYFIWFGAMLLEDGSIQDFELLTEFVKVQ